MTRELIERLDKGTPPFDGWTLRTQPMEIKSLRIALLEAGRLLQTLTQPVRLEWFKDWFFHDQCPSEHTEFSWSEFFRMLETDEAAERFCVDDTLCTFAIYPVDYSWLMRIEVQEPSEDPLREATRFDLSGSLATVRAVMEEGRSEVEEFEPANRFFLPYC